MVRRHEKPKLLELTIIEIEKITIFWATIKKIVQNSIIFLI